jgi:hypothetical protein
MALLIFSVHLKHSFGRLMLKDQDAHLLLYALLNWLRTPICTTGVLRFYNSLCAG